MGIQICDFTLKCISCQHLAYFALLAYFLLLKMHLP